MDTFAKTERLLDDELKLANIDKTRAESEKLRRELMSEADRERKSFWTDLAKIVGGVILGAGGVAAAVTQFEVGEMKAKIAKTELDEAVKQKTAAEQATQNATRTLAQSQKDLDESRKLRDTAQKEYSDLQKPSGQLRTSLAQTDAELRAVHPQSSRPQLAYVQFKGDLTRDFINELRDHLKSDSFNAPGAERIAGNWTSRVKYFVVDDQAAARKLAASVEAFTSSKGCPMSVPVSLAQAPEGQAPPLEVWLSGS